MKCKNTYNNKNKNKISNYKLHASKNQQYRYMQCLTYVSSYNIYAHVLIVVASSIDNFYIMSNNTYTKNTSYDKYK